MNYHVTPHPTHILTRPYMHTHTHQGSPHRHCYLVSELVLPPVSVSRFCMTLTCNPLFPDREISRARACRLDLPHPWSKQNRKMILFLSMECVLETTLNSPPVPGAEREDRLLAAWVPNLHRLRLTWTRKPSRLRPGDISVPGPVTLNSVQRTLLSLLQYCSVATRGHQRPSLPPIHSRKLLSTCVNKGTHRALMQGLIFQELMH